MTGLLTLGVLGAGLSVDAFAAAVGKGAANQRNRWTDALRVGMIFGLFEAVTPAIGWAIGLALSTWIAAVDHWIAFFLLLGVGGHMIHAATKPSDLDTGNGRSANPNGLLRLVATALATSIDATAVGVSLAVMQVNILTACLIIGGVTTVMATLGVMLGRHAGRYIGRYAEMLGGVALIVIGGSILFHHLAA